MAVTSPASVAIVHDYLNQPGGAERVVLEMARIWPAATIYTSLYRADSTFPEFRDRRLRTSFLDGLPVDGGFRRLFPLYPAAFRSFGRLPENLVISSSSGWAHGVRVAPGSFHAVYCYTPARWLYRTGSYRSRKMRALDPALAPMRRWDRAAAHRADLYIAISHEVGRRIRRHYGIDAPVVYPPVDVERFRPRPRGDRLLVVSRLLSYKRVDLAVDAATRAGIALDVVGTGPMFDDLRRRAGPTVAFHGRLPDGEVTDLMESCRAFLLPGEEDFGITPVEANAAGKPVVAFARGGAVETQQDGRSGALFEVQTVDAVLDAVARCDAIDTAPDQLAAMAKRFSTERFRERLRAVLSASSRPAHHDGGRTARALPAARR